MLITHARRAVVAAAAALTLIPVQALAERINCPLPQIRREVTTALPSGWWNTPIVNSLVETRVITIGGKVALQCLYGGAGSIQRYAPEGANCTASGGGFDCVAAGPRTFSTGPLNISQTWTADLDRGLVGDNAAADIWFEAETATLLFITPRNGARISVSGRRNRGRDGCAGAHFSANRFSLSDLPVGTYVCVRTNEGRISEFRVNGLSGGSPKTLSIGYTTWH